jgi:hypothetical protein
MGLEEVRGSGRRSRTLEAAQHEALEMAGSSGGRRRVWRRLKTRRQQARSSGGSRKLWRRQEALEAAARSGGGSKVWRRVWPIAYSSPTRRCLRFTSCPPSTVLLAIDLDLLPAISPPVTARDQAPGHHPPPACHRALAHHPTYACYSARHRCARVLPPSHLIEFVEEVWKSCRSGGHAGMKP